MRSRPMFAKCQAVMLPVLALALSALPSAAQTTEPEAGDAPAQQAEVRTSLIAPGDPPDLFLVYTGDVIGYLDPCG